MKTFWLAITVGCLAACSLPAAAQHSGEKPLIQPDPRQQIMKKMRAQRAAAADPAAPAPLPAQLDLSVKELERRLAIARFSNRGVTTGADMEKLRERAHNLGCSKIVEVVPTGLRLDPAAPRHVDGAMLLARCSDGGHLVATVRQFEAVSGAAITVSPEGYTHKVAGQLTSRLFYKSASGNQKQTLAVVEGPNSYDFSYWSHDDSGQPGISMPDRLDSYAGAAN